MRHAASESASVASTSTVSPRAGGGMKAAATAPSATTAPPIHTAVDVP